VTRTEERLSDALDAVGRAVRDDELRALPSLAPGSGSPLQAGWRRWLAPAAAAAAVLIIAGLMVSPVLRPGTSHTPGGAADGSVARTVLAGPRCNPSTASRSGGPAADHTGAATEVASGSVAGQSWSVWIKKGLSEPAALERGGLVLSGRWYGMCQLSGLLGADLVDAGSRGIAYGYLVMPGSLKVSMAPGYALRPTQVSIAPGHVLRAAQVVRLAGVSAFVAPLAESACDYSSISLEASTATGSAAGFLKLGTCKPGHAVAITSADDLSSSQSVKLAAFPCDAGLTRLDSGLPAGKLTAKDVRVASGSIGGQPWSLWSRKGAHGIDAVKNGGLVLSGRWYGLCSFGFGAASLELINAGRTGVVYGLVVSAADHQLRLAGRPGDVRRRSLPTPTFSPVQGGVFLIGQLPNSACDYRSLTLYPAGRIRYESYQIVLGASCATGQLVGITSSGSDGDWVSGG
jgi:hypothetical protein